MVSSLQTQLVECAAVEPVHALEHCYQQNVQKYAEPCLVEDIDFTLGTFEVLGGLKYVLNSLIKKLGRSLTRQGGQD